MSQQSTQRDANLRTLLEQHWLHARHIESERAWFMSVYAAITGGILTYMSASDAAGLWPICFLIALTLVGLCLTIRWKQAFEHHRNKIEETAKSLNMAADVDVQARHVWKMLRTRYLFSSFYFIVLVGLIVLLATNSY
jgi:uncharacterized membrane protein